MSVLGLGLSFVAVVVLPGLAGAAGLTVLAGEREPRGGVFLARGLAASVGAWLLVAGLLVRTVGISATSAVVAEVVLAVMSVAVLAHPASRRVLRAAGGEAAYLGGAGALSLVAWAPLGTMVWAAASSVGTFASTPWYYWGLARQVLASGHFPETSVEFGRTVPYLADYPLFSAGTAVVLAPLPESAQPVALALVVTWSAVVLGVAASLLARAWGAPAPLSVVAAPLAVTLGIGAFRLLGYRPEGFALGPALLVVVLVLDWYQRRAWPSLAAAAVLAAVVSQVHGIAFLAMALLLVAATVTTVVTSRGRTWHLLRDVGIAAAGTVGAVAVLGLAMGRVSGSGTAPGVADLQGGEDPTWAFRTLALGRDPTPAPTASRLLTASWEDLYEDRTTTVHVVVVVAVLVVLAAIVLRRGRREALQSLLFLVLGAGLLLAVGYVLVHAWDTYVPRRTGSQRLFLEATLVVPVFLAGAAAALVGLLGERRRARGVLTGVLLAGALAGGVLSALQVREEASGWRPDEVDHEALQSLSVLPDAVLLTNAYTEGYVGQVTGGTALLEGRAPYTFPDQLARSVGLLRGAKQFYADPVANRDFLERHDVDYVLWSAPGSFSVASANTFDDAAPPERLEAVPGLDEVVRSPGLVVFRYRPG